MRGKCVRRTSSLASKSAPHAMSARAAPSATRPSLGERAGPRAHARISGVRPRGPPGASTSAPWSTRIRTPSGQSVVAAWWRGVQPSCKCDEFRFVIAESFFS